MRPGREMDTKVAQLVFGHQVYVKRRILLELTPCGERPLKEYSKSIEWAWLVAEKMGISLIPIEGGQWFALVGAKEGWSSPAEYISYLQEGRFAEAGAAVGESAPLMICTAALKAFESREAAARLTTDEGVSASTH